MQPDYVAGYVDGDGSILISYNKPHGRSKNPYFSGLVYATGCDRALAEEFQAQFGGNTKCNIDKRCDVWRPQYLWSISQGKSHELIDLIRPHLILKARQADLLVELGERRKLFHQNKLITEAELAIRDGIRKEVKRLNHEMECPHDASHITIGYVAGIFDAEGHAGTVSHGNNSSGRRVSLTITNNCRCILDGVAGLCGGSVRRGNGGWRWELKGRKCTPVMEQMLPHLIVKRQRCESALEFNRNVGFGRSPHEKQERARIAREMSVMNQKGIELMLPL